MTAVSAIIKSGAQQKELERCRPAKTKKKHRKDTEKTQKRKDKRLFRDNLLRNGFQISPRREDLFYWFQPSPLKVRPRSQTIPLMSCSRLDPSKISTFFRRKA